MKNRSSRIGWHDDDEDEIESPYTTKESFDYFRNRRERWMKSPRVKVQPIDSVTSQNEPVQVTSSFSFDDEHDTTTRTRVATPKPTLAATTINGKFANAMTLPADSRNHENTGNNLSVFQEGTVLSPNSAFRSTFVNLSIPEKGDAVRVEHTDWTPDSEYLHRNDGDTNVEMESTRIISSLSIDNKNTMLRTNAGNIVNSYTPFNTPFAATTSADFTTAMNGLPPFFPQIKSTTNDNLDQHTSAPVPSTLKPRSSMSSDYATHQATISNANFDSHKQNSSASSSFPSTQSNSSTRSSTSHDTGCTTSPSRQDNVDSSESESTSNDAISHRDRLVEFYKKYNPEKLDSVDKYLKSYEGKEEAMFAKLKLKYCTDDQFLRPEGSGPVCFLEFGNGLGRVTIQLFSDKAPLAVENFRCLCTGEKGTGRAGKLLCYMNAQIHRVVPDMCIQGGDFTAGDGTGGESIYRPGLPHTNMWGKFKDDKPFLAHDRPGLLSMANNGPDQNGSQFFITLKKLPHLNGKHVVFGIVTKGMDIVTKIGAVTTNANQRPVEPITITDCGEIVQQHGEETMIRASERNSNTPCSSSTMTTPYAGSSPAEPAPGVIPQSDSGRQSSSALSNKQPAFGSSFISSSSAANSALSNKQPAFGSSFISSSSAATSSNFQFPSTSNTGFGLFSGNAQGGVPSIFDRTSTTFGGASGIPFTFPSSAVTKNDVANESITDTDQRR